MFLEPRVIAIDDEERHLYGIRNALSLCGVACTPVQFTGDTTVPECRHVRVICADLHLTPGSVGEHEQHFSRLVSIIEQDIRPKGPYMVVLWTRFGDQAEKLYSFLLERLEKVTKPFVVRALDKTKFLDSSGDVSDVPLLMDSIRESIKATPQIDALVDWEQRALEAASDTVAEIVQLAQTATGGENLGAELRRILGSVGVGAAGTKHAQDDWYRSVNEGLLPIVADRIGSLPVDKPAGNIWKTALTAADARSRVSAQEAAKLNRLLHIAPLNAGRGSERGAVLQLPSDLGGVGFGVTFDSSEQNAAYRDFFCDELSEPDASRNWVLVQTQAACDYAQMRSGPIPFHLGLCVPQGSVRTDGKAPAALWRSPGYSRDEKREHLHVNARFQVSLTKARAEKAKILFRLREQLLNELMYHLHTYGARPGIISLS